MSGFGVPLWWAPRGALVALALLAPLVLGLLAGCQRYDTLRRDLDTLERWAEVRGEVSVPEWEGGPLVVAAFRAPEREGAPFTRADVQELARPGAFLFRLEPGAYSFCVFEDRDGDRTHGPDEPYGVWEGFEPVALAPAERLERLRLVAGSRGAGPPRRPAPDCRSMRVGELASLDEPRFDAAHGQLGVWEPLAFLRERAYGLFVLREDAPAEPGSSAVRVPVVFVHGITGYAREFEEAVAGLDRARFEPWVFQYASGLPLETHAERLAQALREMRARRGVGRVCLVAHSMGGLVSRAAFDHLGAGSPEVPLFVTLASPLAGHEGAAAGVAMAPVVVPAWNDLVRGSPFLEGLYDPPLPATTHYGLFFAYASSSPWSGAPGDGVVTLESQLRAEAQAEASWMRGFQAGHADILRDEQTLAELRLLLEQRCAAEAGAAEVPIGTSVDLGARAPGDAADP